MSLWLPDYSISYYLLYAVIHIYNIFSISYYLLYAVIHMYNNYCNNTRVVYLTAVLEYWLITPLFGVQQSTELGLEGDYTGGRRTRTGLSSLNTSHHQPESGQQERKLGLHSHRSTPLLVMVLESCK